MHPVSASAGTYVNPPRHGKLVSERTKADASPARIVWNLSTQENAYLILPVDLLG